MFVHELRNKFIAKKEYEPTTANELLDFARQTYIRGELSLSDYRNIIRILEEEGAKKPEYIIQESINS